MKAEVFDEKFDNDNEDIINDLDLSTLKHPNQKQKRVNVDFPVWIIDSLDKEANRIGVTRQSIIKLWLAERLEEQVLNRVRASFSPALPTPPCVRLRTGRFIALMNNGT
jgi:hypothetical protein